ncbi:MAG TPA: exodeoxyribonuclease V subunit gamma [Macromonas sp.]|nr:exodeoxyribonuclease V subunit gamma [Macromonas sp.]
MPTTSSLFSVASAEPAPGFMVLQGNRLEDLRDLLVAQLKREPLPPLAQEVLLVQSNGMKHWLELALAHDDALGICAATRLELPSAFLWQAYRAVLGPAAVPPQLPLDKPALLWRLVRLLPVLVARDPVYAPLANYLKSDADGRKRLQLAQQLADVLDGYQSYRADWLADWAAGQVQLRDARGQALAMPDEQRWQARLWQDVLADLAEHSSEPAQTVQGAEAWSRAGVHTRFMRAMQGAADRPRPAGLPPRITVFGIPSLPMQQVEALAALGQVCQVLLFVQNPCQFHWGDIVEGREWLRQQESRRQSLKPGWQPGADLAQAHLHSHPLLAAWGKQGRDYLHLLNGFDLPQQYRQRFGTIDLFADPQHAVAQATRLQRLQSDILQLNPPPAQPQPVSVDDSLLLSMGYSAQREVECLHDQLLAWFDADATLQPRDVIVMVPDMATFAPHIQAVFGRFEAGEPRHIPYSVADVGAGQLPLARVLEQLLQLPQSRVTLADWLDMFDAPALRQRFGLAADDVATLHAWLLEAGVRWGLDAEHRCHWGLPAGMDGLEHNTWSFGVRRMLLGYAAGGADPWQGVAPLPAVSGLSARLVGALVQWLDAMDQSLHELRQEQTPRDWVATLQRLAERFFEPSDDTEERQLQRLLQPLGPWLEQCDAAALHETLPLVVVREHWLAQWDAPAMHQRFFGGGVQFATLMPMRSIPFRVVCLLGMNDGDYPRRAAARDFDLMAQQMRPGDRSRREDDRYLFLEALLSARDKLYLSWQGRRASDDSEQPPSVLVAQLLDTLALYWQDPPQPVLQPLQPFSRRYFFAPAGQGPSHATYDGDWQTLHALAVPVSESNVAGAIAAMAAVPQLQNLTLSSLERLVREPAEWALRDQLGVRLDAVEDLPDEAEPFAARGLERYAQARAVVQAGDPLQALHGLQLAGRLPLAGFGQGQARRLLNEASTLHERLHLWQQAFTCPLEPFSVDVVLAAPESCRVQGAVTGLLGAASDSPQSVTEALGCVLQCELRPGAVTHKLASRRVPRLELLRRLWVRHVLLSAQGLRLSSVLLGLDRAVWLPPLSVPQAQHISTQWSHLMQACQLAPLPFSAEAALAWVQARHEAQQVPEAKRGQAHEALLAARKVFNGGRHQLGVRDKSPYVARVADGFDNCVPALETWAEPLYGALAAHAQVGVPEALQAWAASQGLSEPVEEGAA